MCFLPSFDLSPEANVAAFIDRLCFSSNHLYGTFYDPEGFLSTFPAIATALLGNLTGLWLLSSHSHSQKCTGLTVAGLMALYCGWAWGLYFPINKTLWTSSYVLWTGGFALLLLACCFWLIEIKAYKQWLKPFELFGMNAMLAYVLHIVFLKIQGIISVSGADGTTANLRHYITEHAFAWASQENASLLYACSYMILWFIMIQIFITRK